jgi:glycosyltransferase involved in cell wall biosynthesis
MNSRRPSRLPSRPKIGLDFSRLDHASVGAGQYRYAVDLMRGLAALSPRADFVVFGSRPQPVPELQPLFQSSAWSYCQFTCSRGRAAWLRDQFLYRRVLRRERIDLLHALQEVVPVLGSWHLVTTCYDAIFDLFPEYAAIAQSRLHRLFRWAVRRRAACAICISQCTADDVARLWGVPHEKLAVIYLATEMKPAQASEPSIAGPFLLSPYNLEPRKNLDGLLSAFAVLRSQFPELKLVLYGRAAVTADREKRFHSQLRRLFIENGVVLTGFVSDQQLAALFSRCELFVFPSVYEGFGLPVLEAMACGACVVAHNDSAMAEVTGDAGLLLDMRSSEQLAAALAALLRDSDRIAALRRAALARAAPFTIEKMARETLAIYERVLGLPLR